MEDMCQLSQKMTEDKYHGSYEQIAKIILKHSVNPGPDVVNFFELALFSFFNRKFRYAFEEFFSYKNDEWWLNFKSYLRSGSYIFGKSWGWWRLGTHIKQQEKQNKTFRFCNSFQYHWFRHKTAGKYFQENGKGTSKMGIDDWHQLFKSRVESKVQGIDQRKICTAFGIRFERRRSNSPNHPTFAS